MKDREFLMWMHARLTEQHGENPLVDYMRKFRAIIKALPKDQLTPNIAAEDSLEELQEYFKRG